MSIIPGKKVGRVERCPLLCGKLLVFALLAMGLSLPLFGREGGASYWEPACRGAVNVNFNPNLCYVAIRPSSLLTGDFVAEDYTVEIFDQDGNSLGDTIPGIYAGQTLQAEVRHRFSNFSCTTAVSVYDESPPVLQIPLDRTLACTESPDPANTGRASADDCTPVDVSYRDERTETYCGNPKVQILRIWQAEDAQGLIVRDTQYIAIVRATANDIRFPPDRDYTCTAYLNDPFIILADPDEAGVPTLVDNPLCGLIYTHQDQRLPLCGDPDNSFIILRRWTVLDACGNTVFTVDGAGNDNVQLIRVLDQTAPVIEPVVQDLSATVRQEDNGLTKCSSGGFIPAPNIVDECNAVTIRIYCALGELEYANGVDGSAGGYIPFPGLALGGPHQIYYEAEDACGNISTTSAYVRVFDFEVPTLLCDQQVTVNLSLGGNGRLEPFMIDKGIRDNCCLDKMQIKWEDEAVTSFRDRIDIYCQSEPRRAVLRAWDCSGNFNDCTTIVRTHDPLPATVASRPPEVIEVDCSADRTIYDDPAYLAPHFQDNCPQDIQFSIRDSVNACGTADLWREWTLQDHPDHPVLRVGQLVRFIDTEAPILAITPLAPVCDTDGDCLAEVQYPLAVSDNCSEILSVAHELSVAGGAFAADPYGQIVQGPQGLRLEGQYPLGAYEIRLTVSDPCGNTVSGRYPLVVNDCTPPSLSCRESAQFFIGEDQQLVLTPEDLVVVVEDNCSPYTLTFARDGAPDRLYDCDSLGIRTAGIWATDTAGNRSKCTVQFKLETEGNGCQPVGNLEGLVLDQSGEGISMVQVTLNGLDTLFTVTGPDGRYRFESVPLDTDYELILRKDINMSNGVSVLDILRLSRHILGLNPLTNPYHILAADVNNSGSVTTMDIIAARRVILGLSDQFADNPHSWRFVPADYVFINPGDPLQERVPVTVNFKLILEESIINFVGLKYGDVNNTADPKK